MKRIKEQHAAEFCGQEPNSDKLETKHSEISPSRIANLRPSILEAEKINSLKGIDARRPILRQLSMEKTSAVEWGIYSRAPAFSYYQDKSSKHWSPVSSLLVKWSLISLLSVCGLCVFQDEYKPNYSFALDITAIHFALFD